MTCVKCGGYIDPTSLFCWYEPGHWKVPAGGTFHRTCCPYHSGADRRTPNDPSSVLAAAPEFVGDHGPTVVSGPETDDLGRVARERQNLSPLPPPVDGDARGVADPQDYGDPGGAP